MHINTLYFSYMKPLNFILQCTMANAQVNLSFPENGRGGIYVSFTCWIQIFCSDTIQSMDLLQNVLCSLYFNNYLVVILSE